VTTRTGNPAMRGLVQEWHVLQRALPATPASARLARMTALVASELVTTVLRHAGPRTITLRVLMTPRRLRLEVHDPSGRLSHALDGERDAASLAVVAASASRWGVDGRAAGAQVWAEIPV
jgi:hypothetical protein